MRVRVHVYAPVCACACACGRCNIINTTDFSISARDVACPKNSDPGGVGWAVVQGGWQEGRGAAISNQHVPAALPLVVCRSTGARREGHCTTVPVGPAGLCRGARGGGRGGGVRASLEVPVQHRRYTLPSLNDSYFVENIKEETDHPREWYYDAQENALCAHIHTAPALPFPRSLPSAILAQPHDRAPLATKRVRREPSEGALSCLSEHSLFSFLLHGCRATARASAPSFV